MVQSKTDQDIPTWYCFCLERLFDEKCYGAPIQSIALERFHSQSICYSCRNPVSFSLGQDKQMYEHQRTDLTNCRGELLTTTSKQSVHGQH